MLVGRFSRAVSTAPSAWSSSGCNKAQRRLFLHGGCSEAAKCEKMRSTDFLSGSRSFDAKNGARSTTHLAEPREIGPWIANFQHDFKPSTRLRTNPPARRPVHSFKMGRLHSNGKGISASAIPYSRNPPAWLKTTPEQVVDQICKLARKGATPSQ